LGLSYLKCGTGLQGLSSGLQDYIPIIASEDVEDSIILALKSLNNCLTVVGPHLYRSLLIISFYEYRSAKGFFGLVTNTEKIVFERWKLPILINQNIIPSTVIKPNFLTIPPSPEILLAREQIQLRILCIIDEANYVDHVPPSLYEYEIEAGFGFLGEKNEQQSIVTRLINSPSLLSNLS